MNSKLRRQIKMRREYRPEGGCVWEVQKKIMKNKTRIVRMITTMATSGNLPR